MEIKAVFFDIDGTLVNDSRVVLKSTEKAIRALKEQGIVVGLATGRGPFFVRPFIERYDFDFADVYKRQGGRSSRSTRSIWSINHRPMLGLGKDRKLSTRNISVCS